MGNPIIGFRVPPDLYEKVVALAEQRGLTLSQLYVALTEQLVGCATPARAPAATPAGIRGYSALTSEPLTEAKPYQRGEPRQTKAKAR